MNERMKVCRKCGTEKWLDNFYDDARFPDGIDIHCSDCRKQKVKKWRDSNLEKAREVGRNSYAKNPEQNKTRASTWYRDNHARQLEYMARRRKTNPRGVLSAKLKATFGITLEQYEAISEKQNHCCAICGTPQAEQRRKMAVDHDHVTDEVRALLCGNCNVGLGNFKDSEQILTKAIKYLYDHRTNKTSNPTPT
jgi:hypothetical protein